MSSKFENIAGTTLLVDTLVGVILFIMDPEPGSAEYMCLVYIVLGTILAIGLFVISYALRSASKAISKKLNPGD
jgi:hypothetical protein